jgi:branched-chain amino acid transport system substrate-binding protein
VSSDEGLDQAIAEFMEAAHGGQAPGRDEFIARRPGYEEGLRDFFRGLDEMNRLFEPIQILAGLAGPTFKPRPFGEYELLEVIGEGGMGVIYRARQTRLTRMVALKMIRAGRLATAEDLERFRTEAKAAAQMDHPNIVPIYEFGEHEGQPYFTMGLIEGRTLDSDERDFRSNPGEAARLIAVVARAIHHAHQRQIIHRDLKPGNIMVDPAGAPRVTDFGLAMTVEAGQRIADPDILIGTLPYMAPEQLSEAPQPLTTSVDIWGLGAILYELLTGTTPFQGGSQADTVNQIRCGAPAPMRVLNPYVPEALEEICLRCLEKEPEQRYGSALALADDLERWLNGEATRVERFLGEARRRELRQELLYVSSAVADRVLMKLKDWSIAVLEAASDPELPKKLRRNEPRAVQDFLDRVRRTFDDPARGFAEADAKSPFESWVLLNDRGVMIGCSPDESIVGQDFSRREWYWGARGHDGKRGLDSVHVSRIFLSVVKEKENRSKFTISVPVYGGNEADAPVIGVLGASFTTDSNFGLPRLNDDRHKVVVVGRWDPDSYGGHSPGDYLVVMHPAYRRGEEAVKVSTPSLQTFVPNPSKGELRFPEPGQVGVIDEEFTDPLVGRDARYKGVRWAGSAPVGNTPFVAIVQQRPDPLIEREAEIVVGQLVDLTGSTSQIGEPYAEGVQAYTDWLNAQGGINRKKVRLVRVDYANRIPEALEIYARLKTVDRVVAIQGWGTGDTEALAQQVSQDLIPMFSASCSAHLADPRKTPYNFFVATDYSTQLRAGLKYLRDTWRETRKPKVAFVYPDHPYGRAPIPAGKAYAHELGFEIVGEENVDLNAISAARQLRNLKVKEPDFTWIGGSTPSTAVILKDARSLGLRTRFFINQWGNDENLMELEEAQGVLGLQASVLLGDDVPGMKAIREATRGEPRATHYVRGWVSMMVLCEGLRRSETRGDLTGPGIKKALETLSDFDPQGLTPPISYTADDHRPSMAVRIYEYSGGKMLHRSTVNVERRPEWLGF